MLVFPNEKYPNAVKEYEEMLAGEKAKFAKQCGPVLEFKSDDDTPAYSRVDVFINPTFSYSAYVTETGLTFNLVPISEVIVFVKTDTDEYDVTEFNLKQRQSFNKDFLVNEIYPNIVNTLRHLLTTPIGNNTDRWLELTKAIKAYEALFVQPQEAEK